MTDEWYDQVYLYKVLFIPYSRDPPKKEKG